MSRLLESLRKSLLAMTPDELQTKAQELRTSRRKITARTKKKLEKVSGAAKPRKPKDEAAELAKLQALLATLTPEQRKQLLGE